MLFSRDAFHVHKSFRVNESSSDGSSNIFHESASIFDNAEQIANAIIEQQKRHQLSSNGGGGTLKSCLVGIVASKSAFLASMVIGVLRTGNAFAIFEPGPASFIERRFARFRIKLALFNATSLPLNEATQFCGTKFVDDGTAFGRLKIGLFDGAKTMQKSDDYDADDGGISMDFGQIAYAIQTSGSTGISKVVLVPFSAILPNIEDFIDRFSLGPLSTVLFATQTHFDPSMVELFVAMRAGAELVIPPPNWLFGKSAVAGGNLLRSDLRLSFVQLTPAVLQCLSMDILRHIFGPNSLIQTLLVGGDNFPLNLVKNYMSPACPMVVYNVYGLTEVSCWASVHRFDPSDTNKHPHNLVPIGQPLMGTRFQISTDGILLIHGRRCAINFEQYNNNDDDGWDERPTSTGDIAFEMTGDEDEGRGKERAIFVRGRYKPNSVLPNPVDIESEVMAAFSEIVFAKLLYVDNCRFLFVDHLDGISALSEREIRAKIAKWQWPTRTFWNIDRGSGTRRRLTENGKIDEHFLRQFVLSKYRGQISLQQFLDKRFGIVPNSEEVLHSSLRSLGIGSLEAAELAFLLQHHSSIDVDDDDEEPTTDTLRFLLDERHTLGQLLCRFSTMISTNANNNGGGTDGGHHGEEPTTNDHDNNNNHDGIFHQQLLQISPKKFDIDEKWAQNLGKCIDGTPICHDGTVYAASHSGTVMGVQLATGVATISLHFPGDRFEAGCSVAGVGNGGGGTTLLAFGGFAGRMRLFTLASTQTKQCQRQEAFVTVDCGAEIRMAPVFDVYDWDHDEYNGNANDADGVKNGTMRLFWGSYNGHIWRLDIICRRHKGNKNGGGTVVVVGDHSMAKFDASRHGTLRTSPLLIRSSDNSSSLPIVIFGTLSATVFAVRCKEFDSVLWSLQMDSPIFAAPIAFVGGCLSLSVKGQILLIRPNDGHIISRATCLLSSNNDYRFFDSPTPIGHADAAAVVDKQHNHLLLISTGANALLLLSYSSHSYRSDLSPNYCNGNDSNSSFSVLRRFVMPCQSATAEYIVRRPVLFDQCRRRFAFLLTNKGTLFRLSLTEILSLSYHNDHSSTDDNVGGPSSSSADAVVVPPVLDCVFTMDHQQQHRGQVETFGHPLLSQYHHHHQTRTTREHEEEIVDDDVDLPFFVVFGARDDLLRARLCVPPQQRHKPN